MKKGLIAAVLLVSFLYGKNLCYDINSIKATSIGIEAVKEYDNLNIPKKYIKKVFDRNIVFAKALVKKYSLNKKDKEYIDLKIAEALANIYMKKESNRFQPNEQEIKSFYIDHKSEFKPILEANLSLISVASLNLADKIYSELRKNPNKFKELAKKYSIDGTSQIGGSLGVVNLDRFPFVIRKWVREHKKGDISEPIKVGNYFFILQLHKKIEKQPTYENEREWIKKLLTKLVKYKKLKEEYKRLKEEGL